MNSVREEVSLDPEMCKARQLRLAACLAQGDFEYALLSRPEHVQYFTGYRPPRWLEALTAIWPDGRTVLCAPNAVPESFVADEVLTFEAQWNCTLRQDQMSTALHCLASFLPSSSRSSRVAVEGSVNPLACSETWGGEETAVHDIEPVIWKLRRKKDPDELRMIRRATECTDSMYRKAREIIQPGISEIEVYNQLVSTAVLTAGEPLTAIGNDFQCNSPGGPPRQRPVQQGELYILDLSPAYRGYFADNCRTFLVDATPSDSQYEVWQTIVSVLDWIEETVRPGVSAAELYRGARDRLDAVIPGGFFHHLGHGIGLSPHEAPHLNDHWDDLFEVGDVFTAEPGLYAPHLKAGIRLEQNYLVTESGIERLTSFPLTPW